MVNKNLRVLFGDRKDLSIPPNDPAYSLTSTKTFRYRFDHRLLSHPHASSGKPYLIRADLSRDGRQETAIEVPRYDFNWQRTYLLDSALERVPKGTKSISSEPMTTAQKTSSTRILNPSSGREDYG
ncbi:MAG: hypothetical protein IPL01_05795 [Acidobacteria bacterium]|nr:hypothetical protein [Acidobacteriota bacterium]